jgi:predicted esterase
MAAGIPAERVILLGFSQGACLALEFSARNPRRYGGIAGLSGGLIGADDDPIPYHGSFAGTPAFLGCSDPDPHIPKRRVLSAAETLRDLGAQVTTRLYPNLGHTVNQDEINSIRQMMAALTNTP